MTDQHEHTIGVGDATVAGFTVMLLGNKWEMLVDPSLDYKTLTDYAQNRMTFRETPDFDDFMGAVLSIARGHYDSFEACAELHRDEIKEVGRIEREAAR